MRVPKVKLPFQLPKRRGPRIAAACAAVALVAIAAWGGVRLIKHWDAAKHSTSIQPTEHRQTEGSARPTRIVAFTEGCSTSECHASMLGSSTASHPLAHARCEECHAPDTGGHLYPVLHSSEGACTSCHSTVQDTCHAPSAGGTNDCLTCHTPHVTAGRFMLAGKPGVVGGACASCHSAADGRYRHTSYTAGNCAACHESHQRISVAIRERVPGQSCAECHASQSGAVSEGSGPHGHLKEACLSCHAPHASDHKGMLIADVREVCLGCHQGVASAAAGATTPHGAMKTAEQCMACHDPHSGRFASMLWSEQTTQCLSCHGKGLTATDGRKIPEMATVLTKSPFKHGPVASGMCGACHAIHGGMRAKLLKGDFSRVPDGKFELASFGLCFSCHSRELVLGDGEAGVGGTQFRDGTKNLHRVHVQAGDKSAGCATCHEVHGGQHPRLMVDAANYQGSDWKAPMRFQVKPEGGSCASGCHAPMSYSRTKGPDLPQPGTNPRGVP